MFLIGLITAISSFILGIAILSFDRKNIANQTFGVFAMGVGVWILSIFITVYVSTTLFWGRMAMASANVYMVALLLFAIVFPDKKEISRSKFFLIMIFAIFFTTITFTRLIVIEIWISDGYINGIFGPFWSFSKFFGPVLISSTFFILIKKYFNLTGFKKIQLKFFLIGILLTLLPALITNAILPTIFGIYKWNTLGPLFTIFMVGFTAYAILKHEFLDIRVIIQRGTIYTILAAMVVGLYIFSVFVLREFLGQKLEVSSLISGVFAVLVGVFTAPPLEKYFRRITDKIFFKDKYDYPESLQHLSRITATGLDQISLIEQAVSSLKQIIKTENAEVILDEPPQETPIVNGERGIRIGVLKLGSKLSGDKYDFEDIKLLQTFSYQLNVALEKTRLYEQVKDYSENLERKVDKRTAEIQRLQNEQRQMMIDISHGLQTPLTVIKGELDVYTKHAFSDRKRDLLARSVGDISNFVDQLLNLASLESKPGLKKEPVDISDLTQDLVEYFQTVARNKKISLLSNVQPGLIVLGQKDKLSEMIMNLVSNAFKYLDKAVPVKTGANGASVVEVGLRAKDGEVVLSVKDNGSGIDPADLPHIFERFYRAKKNNHHNGIPGSGLGLAICKKIVDLHDGRIEVKSRLGEEATFTVHLPMNHP